jgi:hypothetical protein
LGKIKIQGNMYNGKWYLAYFHVVVVENREMGHCLALYHFPPLPPEIFERKIDSIMQKRTPH